MENKKLTAVEWLVEQIKSDQNQKALSPDEWMEVIKQAKAMEKEQMCKFAYKCHNHYKVNGDFKIEQYYNQTYKGGEQ